MDLSEQWLKTIRDAIVRGNPNRAVELAQKALSSDPDLSPRELAEELGLLAVDLYNSFHVEPVEKFYRDLKHHLPAEASPVLDSHLEKPISLTHDWKKNLEDLFTERMAREIRDAVRNKEYDEAVERCKTLLSRKQTPEGVMNSATLVGNILGTLENEQKESDKVIRMIQGDYPRDIIQIIKRSKQERLALIYKTQMEHRSLEWTRNLATMAAGMKDFLPGVRTLGEPKEEDLERFDLLLRSIIRCYFRPPHAGQWHDIAVLLSELCPQEESFTRKAAGLEDRLYQSLTPTQKKLVIQALSRLGENTALVSSLVRFAGTVHGMRSHTYVLDLLGGLKAEGATHYLIGCLENRKLREVHPRVIAALGSLSDAEAREALLDVLRGKLQIRTITPQRRREITQILMSLAKISRNQKIGVEERNTLIREVIEILDDNDSRLNLTCAEQFFLVRLEEINPAFRSWATERLVEGLWFKDPTPSFADAPQSGGGVLGHREKLVQLLIKLGSDFLPRILETAERHMVTYSGAYIAMAEVLGEIGDERALSLLEKLLTASLMMEESSLGKYEKELTWDPANQTRRELDKDSITFALVYAANKIGGDRADEILEDVYARIQVGHYTNPGRETTDILFKAHQRILQSRGQTEAPGEVRLEAPRVSPLELDEALQTLKKHFFLSGAEKKRKKRIAALQVLGKAKDLRMIPEIVPFLEEKDPIVSTAAQKALVDYNTPPMDQEKLRRFLRLLIRIRTSSEWSLQKRIDRIFPRLRPEREVMKAKINRIVEGELDPAIRTALEKIFENQIAVPPANGDPTGKAPPTNNADQNNRAVGPSNTGALNELERKRRYHKARKEWIAGGKKGDPPKLEDFQGN